MFDNLSAFNNETVENVEELEFSTDYEMWRKIAFCVFMIPIMLVI